jgi:hypothetical protein
MRRRSRLVDFQSLQKARVLLSSIGLDYDQCKNVNALDQMHISGGKYRFTSSSFRQEAFIPMPDSILKQHDKVEQASFAGIFAELDTVWITVDRTLYLWDYSMPIEENCVYVYRGICDVILGITLATPQSGVFPGNVKYLLIVQTQSNIEIHSISVKSTKRGIDVSQTDFVVATPSHTFNSIACSQKGRIFLACSDGNLYELVYSNDEATWASYFGLDFAKKAKLVRHGSFSTEGLISMLPFFDSIRDTSRAENSSYPIKYDMSVSISHLLIDDLRSVLYTFSVGGILSVYHTGLDGKATNLCFRASILEKVNSWKNGAQNKEFNHIQHSTWLALKSMHSVPIIDSRLIHLVLILDNGFRVYLTLCGNRGQSYSYSSNRNFGTGPSQIKVSHIRGAFSRGTTSSIDTSSCSNDDREFLVNYLDGVAPNYDDSLKGLVHIVHYSPNFFLVALGHAKGPQRVAILNPDLKHHDSGEAGGSIPASIEDCPYYARQRNIDEEIAFLPWSGKAYDFVYDIKERVGHNFDREKLSAIKSFFASAAQPETHSPQDDCHNMYFYPNCLPHQQQLPGREALQSNEIDELCCTNELASQYITSYPFASFRRQFVFLTGLGVQVITPRTPLDHLVDTIRSFRGENELTLEDESKLTKFVIQYGKLESCAMCIGAFAYSASFRDDSEFRLFVNLAISALRRLRGNPSLDHTIENSNSDSAGLFRASTLHDALILSMSRVLRPIWHQHLLSSKEFSLAFLDMIRNPLMNFVEIFELFYDKNSLLEEHSILSYGSLHVANSMRLIDSQREELKHRDDLVSDANRREFSSIQCLYRFVKMCVQALDFVNLVLDMNSELGYGTAPKFDGDLGPYEFNEFVVDARVHDIMKQYIIGFIYRECFSPGADIFSLSNFAEQLRIKCHSYFSQGDLHWFEVIKHIGLAERSTTGAEKRLLVSHAIDCAIRASKWWRRSTDVQGSSSKLTGVCDLFIKYTYDDFTVAKGIMQVCMSAACNFSTECWFDTAELEPYHGWDELTDSEDKICRQACFDNFLNFIRDLEKNGKVSDGDISYLATEALKICQHENLLFSICQTLYEVNVKELRRIELNQVETFLLETDLSELYEYYCHHSRYFEAALLMENLGSRDNVVIAKRIHHISLAYEAVKEARKKLEMGRLISEKSLSHLLEWEDKRKEIIQHNPKHHQKDPQKLLLDYLSHIILKVELAKVQQMALNRLKDMRDSSCSIHGSEFFTRNLPSHIQHLEVTLLPAEDLFEQVC